MNLLIDILSGLCLLAGSFLCLTGAIGLLRLPDIFCRLHAASLNETLGTPLILLGLMLQTGLTLTSAKLAMVAIFILATNPTATHAMSRAALHSGERPVLDDEAQEKSSSKS